KHRLCRVLRLFYSATLRSARNIGYAECFACFHRNIGYAERFACFTLLRFAPQETSAMPSASLVFTNNPLKIYEFYHKILYKILIS
ncbi:MAG: hypothetical protein II923_01695, partial [Campylobacter sp.]|nr:hypothetical protein [Campylobacter sp.]